jgi:hypothetical protein
VVQFARRLAGLLVAVALAAGLPLAAARAGCLCDHGHAHGGAAAEPHTCTAACTAATCPMHRRAATGRSDAGSAATSEGVRCSCAGDAQALIGQATVAGVLPALVTLAAPVFALASRSTLVEAPLRLAASPPAPPPRA